MVAGVAAVRAELADPETTQPREGGTT